MLNSWHLCVLHRRGCEAPVILKTDPNRCQIRSQHSEMVQNAILTFKFHSFHVKLKVRQHTDTCQNFKCPDPPQKLTFLINSCANLTLFSCRFRICPLLCTIQTVDVSNRRFFAYFASIWDAPVDSSLRAALTSTTSKGASHHVKSLDRRVIAQTLMSKFGVMLANFRTLKLCAK